MRLGGVRLADLALLVSVVTLFQKLSTPQSALPRTGPVSIGPRWTVAQLRMLAARIGFPDPDTAAAVAMAESSGDPRASGDGGHSLGLWQINLPSHPELAGQNLLDPETNARAALSISQGGTNWQPWTQFKNGAYRQYLATQPMEPNA